MPTINQVVEQLIPALKRHGCKDPVYVANCLHIHAKRVGIHEAIQTAKRNRPDWFPVVGDKRPPRPSNRQKQVESNNRRNDAASVSAETAQEPP